MIERFARFPADLARRARSERVGDIPILLAHPDWSRPAPTVLWLHGRTVNKELDPGRYLRWVRAGIAACAIDLPGHGERAIADMQSPARTLEVLTQVLPEIDQVIEALAAPAHAGLFDVGRLGIGGMSAGGMATLRRLCQEHPFRCAAVESTTGDLAGLYSGRSGNPWPVRHDPAQVARLDPIQNLSGWRPIPLLALHSELDRVVPIASQRRFIEALRARYAAAGADPALVDLVTWPSTGAPEEHAGFGRYANDAKNLQTEFFGRWLGGQPPAA